MPDRVLPDRKIIDGAILRNAPGFRQVRLRQALLIESNQSGEQQSVHRTVGSVVPIQQRVEASKGTDQPFGIDASLFGLGKDRSRSGWRLLAEQQYSHNTQRHQDDQYLPA